MYYCASIQVVLMKVLFCLKLCNGCFDSLVAWSRVGAVQRIAKIFNKAGGLAALEALLFGDDAIAVGGGTPQFGNHKKNSFVPEDYELAWKIMPMRSWNEIHLH